MMGLGSFSGETLPARRRGFIWIAVTVFWDDRTPSCGQSGTDVQQSVLVAVTECFVDRRVELFEFGADVL